MIKQEIYYLVLLVFLGWSCQSNSSFSSDLQEVLETNQLVGLSVLVLQGDEVLAEEYLGVANLDDQRPVTADTRYRIASISKTVAATGLMKLYEEGKFQLDDDIGEVLGYNVRNPRYPDIPVTFRMLLNHTSSLRDGSGYGNFLFTTYRRDTLENMKEILQPGGMFYTEDMWAEQAPGTYFAYCNLAYGVLGALIEQLSGERFDRYIRDKVLLPIGIEGSFNVRDINDLSTIATLYREGEPTADNYQGEYPAPLPDTYEIGKNGTIFGPQGSLRVSPRELSLYLRMHMNHGVAPNGTRILDSTTVDLMHQLSWSYDGKNGDNLNGFNNAYGLSFHLTGNPGQKDFVFPGVPMIGHSGEAYGLVSEMQWDPESRLGLILMTNGYFSEEGHASGVRTTFFLPEEQVFDLVEGRYLKRARKSD